MTAPWVDTEEAPLESGEVICTACNLAYNRNLPQCSNCDFYGPPFERSDEARLIRRVQRNASAFAVAWRNAVTITLSAVAESFQPMIEALYAPPKQRDFVLYGVPTNEEGATSSELVTPEPEAGLQALPQHFNTSHN